MSENLKFTLNILGVTLTLLLLALAAVSYFGTSHLAWGVFYGYLVSLINILFAFFSIKWAFNKPNKTFYAVVLGGMGVRFLTLGIAMFLVWKFAQVPMQSFVLSLIGFYLTLQYFEIRYLQKELEQRKAFN